MVEHFARRSEHFARRSEHCDRLKTCFDRPPKHCDRTLKETRLKIDLACHLQDVSPTS